MNKKIFCLLYLYLLNSSCSLFYMAHCSLTACVQANIASFFFFLQKIIYASTENSFFCEPQGQENFNKMNICAIGTQKELCVCEHSPNESISLSSPYWFKSQKIFTFLLNSYFVYSWRVLSLTCFHLWQPQVNLRLKFLFQSKMDPF